MILETQRLILRPLEKSDCKTMTRYFQDEELVAPLEIPPIPFTLSHAASFYEMHQKKYNQDIFRCFAITPKSSTELIGIIDLPEENKFNNRENASELGYWLGKEHWGQGYITEAISAVVKYGFEQFGFIEIVAHTNTDNAASKAVLMKLGFTYVGDKKPEKANTRGTVYDSCFELKRP